MKVLKNCKFHSIQSLLNRSFGGNDHWCIVNDHLVESDKGKKKKTS